MTINEPDGGQSPAAVASAAQLRQSLGEILTESQALRTDVHAAEQARTKATRLNLMVLVALCVPILLLLALAWQNNRLARELHDTNDRIADCTAAGGVCYEEGRKRTGTAIQDVISAEIFMAQCARLFPDEAGPAYDRKLENCVAERLTAAVAARATPTPSPVTPAPRPTGSVR